MEPQNQTPHPNVTPAPAPSPPAAPHVTPPAPPADAPLTKSEKLKRVFLKVLIGCLLASAAIAVTAVLAGSFNDTFARALGTILMVALHALLSFGYIDQTEKMNKKDGGRSIELFSNAVFALIVISFVTSIFAIWQVLDGSITLRLYLLYGVLLFANLHADVLYRIRKFEKKVDSIVTTNYVFMAIVVAMLCVVIFSSDPSNLSSFFYRLLAAMGIIDATTTITAIIMHKMYLQKHPAVATAEAKATQAHSKNILHNPFIILLLIYLVFQLLASLITLFAKR